MATASAKKAGAQMATALTTKRPTARATMTTNVHQLLMKPRTGVLLLLLMKLKATSQPQLSPMIVIFLRCSATATAPASSPRHQKQKLLPTSLATKEQKTQLALNVTYEKSTRRRRTLTKLNLVRLRQPPLLCLTQTVSPKDPTSVSMLLTMVTLAEKPRRNKSVYALFPSNTEPRLPVPSFLLATPMSPVWG